MIFIFIFIFFICHIYRLPFAKIFVFIWFLWVKFFTEITKSFMIKINIRFVTFNSNRILTETQPSNFEKSFVEIQIHGMDEEGCLFSSYRLYIIEMCVYLYRLFVRHFRIVSKHFCMYQDIVYISLESYILDDLFNLELNMSLDSTLGQNK